MNKREQEDVKDIFRILGNNCRLVGGVVRDSIIDRRGGDIDFATPLTPTEVRYVFNSLDIKVIDTGIEHGTVTVVLGGNTYEITTLRKDVATDGRHAVVEFTYNYEEDSIRRDFTFNAMYEDHTGKIFDYHDGFKDITAGIVRFVGDPEQRIREDYLRILRWFRFHSIFGRNKIDQASFNACEKLHTGLDQISGERIQKELFKMMLGWNVAHSLRLFLPVVGMKYFGYERNRIPAIEKLVDINCPLPIVYLACCLTHFHGVEFPERVKLSTKDKQDLNICMNKLLLYTSPAMTPYEIQKALYLYGRDHVRLSAYMVYAKGMSFGYYNRLVRWSKLFHDINTYNIPEFPVSGNDLIAKGYKQGRELGMKLKEIEQKWIDEHFPFEIDWETAKYV